MREAKYLKKKHWRIVAFAVRKTPTTQKKYYYTNNQAKLW